MTGKDKGKGKPKAKEIPQAQEKQASPQPESQPNEAHSNPFIEIPHKRMRALKKRLVRIEKNEEAKSKGVTLDADQIRSIEQKQEVLDILRELEDLIKFMTVVESEEAAKAAKLKKQQEQDEQKKISDAKVQSHQEFKKALDLVFILNVFANEGVRMLFTSGGVDGFVLSVEELNQLDTIAFVLYGQYNPAAGLVVSSKGFHDRLFKLSSRSSEAISAGFTYANAHELLTKISLSSFFDPALAAKLAEERAIAQAAAEAALREQEEMQRSYEIISYEEVPVPSHMSPEQMNGLPGGKPLAFFGESELLGGMRPKLSFDGSPEVIVPIPQTLFDHQVRLPAAPVSASTPAASQPQNSTPEHAQPSEAIAVAQALETPAPLVEGSHRGHGRGASRGTRGGRGGYDRNQPRHERRPHDDRSGDNRNFERQTTNNHRDDGGFQRKGGYSRGGHRDGGAQ